MAMSRCRQLMHASSRSVSATSIRYNASMCVSTHGGMLVHMYPQSPQTLQYTTETPHYTHAGGTDCFMPHPTSLKLSVFYALQTGSLVEACNTLLSRGLSQS